MNAERPADDKWKGIARAAACLLCAALLAWLSFADAAVGIARNQNPDAALAIRPNDAVALAARGTSLLQQAADAGKPEIFERLARQSLNAQPLNAPALRLLGYAADLRGQPARAATLINFAEKITRRDLWTQIWLIEERVRVDDVPGALRHYDIALRTSTAAGPILVPVLAQALNEPAIRHGLAGYVRSDPPWLEYFLSHAISNVDPRDVMALAIEAGGLPEGEQFRTLENHLLTNLIARGHPLDAKRYFLTIKGADPRVLTALDFDAATMVERFAPITWEQIEADGVTSDWNNSDDGAHRTLEYSATSDRRSMVARKLLFLAPGRYVLRFDAAYRERGSGSQADWSVLCLRETQATLTGGSFEQGKQSLAIDIPQDCPAQAVVLSVSTGADPRGLDFVLRSASVQRGE